MYAAVLGIVTPDSFGLMFSIQFLMMAVLGGLRMPSGAIVGAVLVWWLSVSLDGFSLGVGGATIDILPGAVFAVAVILTILFLPLGLVGEGVRWTASCVARIRGRHSPKPSASTGTA